MGGGKNLMDIYMRPLQSQGTKMLAPCSSLSTGSNLAKAMSLVALDDAEVGTSQQMEASQGPTIPINRCSRPVPKRLALELTSQPSQEMLGTPDYSTPVEQQFLVSYEQHALNLDDECSRSPAASPFRLQKRPRAIHDVDSECTSQASQSQSKSQGEPSTCSKATSGGPSARPPIPRNRRRHEQPIIRNPYITKGSGEDNVYHANQPKLEMPPRTSRLSWDYKVEKELGHGNFSTVFKAIHRQSGKHYAIKKSKKPVLSVSEKNTWLAEIQALAAVEGHPNIVTYYDSWVEPATEINTGESIFIKLELCGESLSGMVQKKIPMKEAELLDILRQMASALKHMHDMGLVHLDLKPDNILRGKFGVFKLGDFGLATAKDGSGRVNEGDARYLAPELLRNNYSSLDKADMFALGATLYELGTGCPLPTGGDRYHQLRNGQQAMMPHISMKLQNLIKKLMSPDPKLRPSADAILKSALVQTGTIPMQISQPSPRGE